MQLELKKLQKKLGITFIYITHDQEEAINMSDRIAVMNHGTFEQIGSPDEIYNHPKTSYVATFVGNANILKGKAEELEGDKVRVSLAGGSVLAAADGNTPARLLLSHWQSAVRILFWMRAVRGDFWQKLSKRALQEDFSGLY